MEGFYTVQTEARWEQTVNKSRFIALICPAANQVDCEEALTKIRLQYPNARHYVYAYRLFEGRLEKASDDGEPQGTGGRPLLDVLQHRLVWNIILVVVRYFGGILLGTGGLTRAYGGTARRLLEETNLTLLQRHACFNLVIPYSHFERLKYEFGLRNWQVSEPEFNAEIKMTVFLPTPEENDFNDWLDEQMGRQVRWQKTGEIWR